MNEPPGKTKSLIGRGSLPWIAWCAGRSPGRCRHSGVAREAGRRATPDGGREGQAGSWCSARRTDCGRQRNDIGGTGHRPDRNDEAGTDTTEAVPWHRHFGCYPRCSSPWTQNGEDYRRGTQQVQGAEITPITISVTRKKVK
jgi:hypothetical protein